ncbi:MAG: DUF4956 domain-containing protein [Flavobacteriales bacterium]|nr:DUF4956 domain-containing protein [Flavobacteriales bacterium]
MQHLLFIDAIDITSLYTMLLSYLLHTVVMLILVFLIYFSTFRNKNFVFTFFLIGTIVFFISYVMSKLNLNVGFALGLFAIFGIIRYRTDQIPIREMTYLFIIIGLSVLNGISKHILSLFETALINIFIVLTVFIFEKVLNLRTESYKFIVYERLDLLKSSDKQALLDDLRERTGVKVERVMVIKYHFLKQVAYIRAYYHSKKGDPDADFQPSNDNDDED